MNNPFTVAAIQDGTQRMAARARSGALEHFNYQPQAMQAAVERVLQCMRRDYGELVHVPWHSRWVHLKEAPEALWSQFTDVVLPMSALERRYAKFELIVLSVLLDGGAGSAWRFEDSQSRQVFSRSEGLAVASLALFLKQSACVRGEWLKNFALPEFSAAFQISAQNPLEGAKSRVDLLQRLGARIIDEKQPRLGAWLDRRLGLAASLERLGAEEFLNALIESLRGLWGEQGDVGFLHGEAFAFHKLILWLGYSLMDTLRQEGASFAGITDTPGLAEYRNGGLFIDCGVLQPKDPKAFTQNYSVGDALVVEWRAMTLVLLQDLASALRNALAVSPEKLPMAKVLQAGSWAAGRELAQQKRDGRPPFSVNTQGILF